MPSETKDNHWNAPTMYADCPPPATHGFSFALTSKARCLEDQQHPQSPCGGYQRLSSTPRAGQGDHPQERACGKLRQHNSQLSDSI
eukprot:2143249-Amphidinium_carterae.2